MNSDRKVDTTDYNQVMAVRQDPNSIKRATAPTILNADVNGTGVIDAGDSNAVAGARTRGATVAPSPPWTLDAVELRGGTAGSAEPVRPLTQQDLPPLVAAAIGRWQAAGLAPAATRVLEQLVVRIEDVPAPALGLYGGGVIYLDVTAEGRGWFVDPTPSRDEEFGAYSDYGVAAALADTAAAGRVDLLTVLAHEMGHALGMAHVEDSPDEAELMAAGLAAGVRKPVTPKEVAAIAGDASPTSLILPVLPTAPALGHSAESVALGVPLPPSSADRLFARLGKAAWSVVPAAAPPVAGSRPLASAAAVDQLLFDEEDAEALLDSVLGAGPRRRKT